MLCTHACAPLSQLTAGCYCGEGCKIDFKIEHKFVLTSYLHDWPALPVAVTMPLSLRLVEGEHSLDTVRHV